MWQISTRRAELKIQKSVYNPGQITAKKSLNYADVRSRGPCTTTTNGTKGRKKREKRDFPFFIPIFLCVHLACTSLVNILKQREDWRRLKGGRRAVSLGETFQPHSYRLNIIIAELAERSSIIIQNSSNPSSRKILDVRPYDRTTVHGATFNMRGQLYRGHTNTTALSSSPVVSALGSESDDSGSSPGRGKALCP